MHTFHYTVFTERKTIIALHIVLVIFVFLCFRAGLDNYFAGDDFDWLFTTLKIQGNPSHFITSQGFFLRYTEELYFLFNFWIADFNPIAYQFSALLIHLINVVLVSILITQLCKNPLAGLLGAAFWGVNYKHVEAVFRPYGVADSLALLLCLAAFLLFLYKHTFTALLLFFLGLFAKENAVVFPAIMSAYIVLWGDRQTKQMFKRSLPFWFLAAFAALLGLYARKEETSYLTLNWEAVSRLWEILLSYIGSDIIYLKQVWLSGVEFILPVWIAIVLSVLGGLAFWKLSRIYQFALLWVLITTLPTVFVEFQTSRYYYIPLVGIGIIVGHGLTQLVHHFWKKRMQSMMMGVSVAFTLLLIYFMIGVNAEEQDYDRFGEFHRQAAISLKRDILPYLPHGKNAMTVFPNSGSDKWIRASYEQFLLKPWYLPVTYKWVYVRPLDILKLANTYAFVTSCAYKNVPHPLFVKMPEAGFREKLQAGEYSIVLHDDNTNRFYFGDEALKAKFLAHHDGENFYPFLRPGYFDPTYTGGIYF